MSENLDLVRSAYAGWERGDFSAPERWAAPDIEWVIADGPTAEGRMGVAGMTDSFTDMLRAWDDLRLCAEEYRVLDDVRVLVLTRMEGHGRTSGLAVSTYAADLYYVRDGRVTKIVHYWDRNRALADLGLEE
jgi:ketosteroid isomerase-like protein